VTVDRNLYFNNNTGEYEEGYRDPITHVIHFGSGEPPEATEAAVRKAQELSVSLGEVEGSGKEGKVTVPDVESYYKALQEPPPPQESPTPQEGGQGAQAASGQPQEPSDGETEEQRAQREARERAEEQERQAAEARQAQQQGQ
jgi:pyruvate/2-oxoglutarate dehydrogenase complex dihydrolipoamide acyltransferase (E2) component